MRESGYRMWDLCWLFSMCLSEPLLHHSLPGSVPQEIAVHRWQNPGSLAIQLLVGLANRRHQYGDWKVEERWVFICSASFPGLLWSWQWPGPVAALLFSEAQAPTAPFLFPAPLYHEGQVLVFSIANSIIRTCRKSDNPLHSYPYTYILKYFYWSPFVYTSVWVFILSVRSLKGPL